MVLTNEKRGRSQSEVVYLSSLIGGWWLLRPPCGHALQPLFLARAGEAQYIQQEPLVVAVDLAERMLFSPNIRIYIFREEIMKDNKSGE